MLMQDFHQLLLAQSEPILLTRRRRGVPAITLPVVLLGQGRPIWRQAEVLQEPRVQLSDGLDCTKEKPTSVPTTR
jgi:hypothetical protein